MAGIRFIILNSFSVCRNLVLRSSGSEWLLLKCHEFNNIITRDWIFHFNVSMVVSDSYREVHDLNLDSETVYTSCFFRPQFTAFQPSYSLHPIIPKLTLGTVQFTVLLRKHSEVHIQKCNLCSHWHPFLLCNCDYILNYVCNFQNKSSLSSWDTCTYYSAVWR